MYTAILGTATTLFGIWLRLSARSLAWPRQYSYQGPRAETVWAMREQDYIELSRASLFFGLALLLLLVINWLWTPSKVSRE